jgi:predicted RNase H-like nuclease (RuvC/YqgF family)
MDNATEYMAGINPPSEVEQLRESVAYLERALRESKQEIGRLQDELEFLRSTRADDRDRY